MYHNPFRITLFCTAIAIILSACAAPASEQPIATLAPATEAVPTATEIAPTNTPTATQVVLGVFTGTIAFRSHRDSGADEIWVINSDGSGLFLPLSLIYLGHCFLASLQVALAR